MRKAGREGQSRVTWVHHFSALKMKLQVYRRYGEAEEMARMSLEVREFQCGAESLPAAASLAALAAVLAATQRPADAEALARRCLKIRCASASNVAVLCQLC